ncbi:hypothetical protein [Shewanella cutis]|uniref:Uncharacterized protein n=1 Tax=Shewanella cutis TaxID=2766780 RepID=A0ABS9R0V3_9GAMM|nr:hypothetical protein [Shewanella sp. PS-2]MCG9966237.1 hypothetical protein [Shewanella sp. PS-2]
MSDHYICFIPTTVDYVPKRESQNFAVKLLKCWGFKNIKIETSKYVEFHHCGENFETIHCPHCNSSFSIELWQELMDKDYSKISGFNLSEFTMSCCKKKTTLNNLYYHFPMGFSKFIVRVDDSNLIESHQIYELETVLNCKLKVIYRMC